MGNLGGLLVLPARNFSSRVLVFFMEQNMKEIITHCDICKRIIDNPDHNYKGNDFLNRSKEGVPSLCFCLWFYSDRKELMDVCHDCFMNMDKVGYKPDWVVLTKVGSDWLTPDEIQANVQAQVTPPSPQ